MPPSDEPQVYTLSSLQLPSLATETHSTTAPVPSTSQPQSTAELNMATPSTPVSTMSNNQKRLLLWPDPLVIPPTAAHTATAIILHGRGANAACFGFDFLASPTRSGRTLPQLCPGLKFIFPLAKKRRAALFARLPITQWFDNYSLADPALRPHLQLDGLRETAAFVHALVDREARALGSAARVVLGGLSQGCAASLHVLLNWTPGAEAAGEHIGGYFGMSGWLPFAAELDPRAERSGEDKGEDGDGVIFGSDSDGDGDEDDVLGADDAVSEPAVRPAASSMQARQVKAANTARDIASLEPLGDSVEPAFSKTPMFLGHGIHDDKVKIALGEQARDVFEALGVQVQWEAYDEGHWYKVPNQIDDVAAFFKRVLENEL